MDPTYYQHHIEQIIHKKYSNRRQLEIVIGMRRFLTLHFAEEISMQQLAKRFHTSKFHLLRVFKKYYGQTPKQYLREKRIERAKQLLRSGSTVSACCTAIGYESLSSFSVLFKNRTGMNPSAFQKAQLSRNKTD